MGTEIYASADIHHAMVGDTVRNDAFARALRAVVRPGMVGADIGAGTGILSRLAIEAGAERVYAIERTSVALDTRRDLAARGLSDRVPVLHGDVREVNVPEPLDFIVSEWLGAFGVDENLLPMALVARDRWLKPEGHMLPATVRAMAALVDAAALPEIPLQPLTPGVYWALPFLPARALLSKSICMWSTDTKRIRLGEAALPFRSRSAFKPLRRGLAGGLVTWFESDLGAGIPLANPPGGPATHWGNFVFVPTCPIEAIPEKELPYEFNCIPAGQGFSHYAWSLLGPNGWVHGDSRG